VCFVALERHGPTVWRFKIPLPFCLRVKPRGLPWFGVPTESRLWGKAYLFLQAVQSWTAEEAF